MLYVHMALGSIDKDPVRSVAWTGRCQGIAESVSGKVEGRIGTMLLYASRYLMIGGTTIFASPKAIERHLAKDK